MSYGSTPYAEHPTSAPRRMPNVRYLQDHGTALSSMMPISGIHKINGTAMSLRVASVRMPISGREQPPGHQDDPRH
eukprot:8959320-Heterocapsa_arctica.AAC.1